MREKEVEQKLVKAVRKAGGFCIKFISPGFDGVPDRLVLLPNVVLCQEKVQIKYNQFSSLGV